VELRSKVVCSTMTQKVKDSDEHSATGTSLFRLRHRYSIMPRECLCDRDSTLVINYAAPP
jgi:hypothetical protein